MDNASLNIMKIFYNLISGQQLKINGIKKLFFRSGKHKQIMESEYPIYTLLSKLNALSELGYVI